MMGDASTAAPLDTNEERLTITEIINHPGYNDNTFDNDIAVIKVSGSFTCSQGKIWPACLPSSKVLIRYIEIQIIPVCTLQRFTYVGWEDTIVSGWGRLSSAGEVSDTLQWVKVPPVSDATCNQPNSYDGELTANMICAGKNRNTNTRRFPNIGYIRPIYL